MTDERYLCFRCRFGIYEVAKQAVSPNGEPIPFHIGIGMASVAGACGGFFGTPADLINVRMQNDIKLPVAERRNYKHAVDGLARVKHSRMSVVFGTNGEENRQGVLILNCGVQ
jgi:hypothetical protein